MELLLVPASIIVANQWRYPHEHPHKHRNQKENRIVCDGDRSYTVFPYVLEHGEIKQQASDCAGQVCNQFRGAVDHRFQQAFHLEVWFGEMQDILLIEEHS